MVRYILAMLKFGQISDISILLLIMTSCVSADKCTTEVDILWQKYGELKADIEQLKTQFQISGSSCTTPSTAEDTDFTKTTSAPVTEQPELKDIGFELISVIKQNYSDTNETELTVNLLAPEDAVFYWFESYSQFIPAYDNGTVSTSMRRGKLAQIKIKKYFREPIHVLFGFSKSTSFYIKLNIDSDEQEFSSPTPSNCKYYPAMQWETESTINHEIKFQCNPVFRNLTKLSEHPRVSAEIRGNGVELKEVMPDSSFFNASQTEENDDSITVETTISKQVIEKYYWVSHGVAFTAGYTNKLVGSISFFVATYLTVNGDLTLPNGFVGINRLGYNNYVEGEHSFIACAAFGNPVPNVYIAKKDENDGHLHYLSIDQRTNSIDAAFMWSEMTSVSLSDAGEYSCLASVNGSMESINFTVSVRPKEYSFGIRDIQVNSTSDNSIYVTFKAIGFTDISASCRFYNAPYLATQPPPVNDTVTITNKNERQALITYETLVFSAFVSIGSIDCDVRDMFRYKHISISLDPDELPSYK